MDDTDIVKIAGRKPAFLPKLSQECREIVINTVNEAFDRKYTIDDEIEVLSYKSFSVRSDRERIYELKLVSATGQGLALCLIERESGTLCAGAAHLFFDELVLNMGHVAMIFSKDYDRIYQKIHCIIDTPGGSVKFPIPTVKLNYSGVQILESFIRWAN